MAGEGTLGGTYLFAVACCSLFPFRLLLPIYATRLGSGKGLIDKGYWNIWLLLLPQK
jgi:hypothetical protein